MRFSSHTYYGGETITAVTASNIICSAGLFATGGNTGYPICRFFKLNRLEIWANGGNTSGGSSPLDCSVGVRWYSNQNFGTNTINSDASMANAYPAHITCKPPKGSYASLWQFQNTNVLFDFVLYNCSSVYVDVHYSARFDDQSYNPTSITTTNTMTVGSTYYPPLDGVSSANFARVMLPSII